MSNYEAIAYTRAQEDGYDSYWENPSTWEINRPEETGLHLRGDIHIYKPREVKRNDRRNVFA